MDKKHCHEPPTFEQRRRNPRPNLQIRIAAPFFRGAIVPLSVVFNIRSIGPNRCDVGGAVIGQAISPGDTREIRGVFADDRAVLLIGLHFCIKCPVAAQLLGQHPSRRSRHFIGIEDLSHLGGRAALQLANNMVLPLVGALVLRRVHSRALHYLGVALLLASTAWHYSSYQIN